MRKRMTRRLVVSLGFVVLILVVAVLLPASDSSASVDGQMRDGGNGRVFDRVNSEDRSTRVEERSGRLSFGGRPGVLTLERAEFDRAWDRAVAAGATDQDRLANLSLMFGRLGRREGAAELAYERISNEYGPGRSRTYLIGAIFMCGAPSEELGEIFEKLEAEEEISAACSGLSNHLCMKSSPQAIVGEDLGFLGERRDVVIGSALEEFLKRVHFDEPDELKAAIGEVFGLGLDSEVERRLLGGLAESAPFECWEAMVSERIDLPKGERDRMTERMFLKDAERALEMVLSTPESESHLSESFLFWMENDSAAPLHWLEQNRVRMSERQLDAAYAGIATSLCRSGDFERSRDWIARMVDPDLRRASEDQIWRGERAVLRRKVQADASGTLDAFIDGESSFSDYWLEEAMYTWISKDFDAANSWYEDNWDSVPNSKSQYVAAAFATQAIGQGDVETARQWAGMIQDPKTKERIKGAIAKAAEE